jgi:hypothetical protein
MDKTKAIELLGDGGGSAVVARKLGISYQAVEKWPDPLPPRIADRIVAALAREHMPKKLAQLLELAKAA